MFDKADLYYFSPTGGTRKAGMIFCEGIAKNVRAVDLGLKEEVKQPESGQSHWLSMAAVQERTERLLGALKTVRRENEFFL